MENRLDTTNDVGADETKMPLTSHDVDAERLGALRALFPEAWSDGTLDVEKLAQLVGQSAAPKTERYGLSWAGKAEAHRVVQSLSTGTLRPAPQESVNFDTSGNLILEGDNLEVLKLLQKSYARRVKMIYIDPPYNTGNEFIYPDNFREGLQTYLEYSGQVQGGVRQSTNAETNGRYHSNWLNMMYPRLFLARNLLKDDGVIFISIDDHEVHNLRLMMNEIFGEENFIGQLVWKSRISEDTRAKTGLSTDHEYIVCFRRSEEGKLRGAEKDVDKFSNPDKDERGVWRSADLTGLANKAQRPNLHYDLIDPETGINYGCPSMGWRYDRKTMALKIAEKRIIWPPQDTGRPRHKLFFEEMNSLYKNLSSLIVNTSTASGTREVNELLGNAVFDFPKPADLIKIFASQVAEDSDTILDFFAGSGTTAQAVLELNKEDGGNRQFILVQLPEPTGNIEYSNIAEITKERVRRVIAKMNTAAEGKLPLGDGTAQDRGFKVFKLDASNFKVWDSDAAQSGDALAEQLRLYAEHRLPNRSSHDILFELLLKSGRPLSAPLEERSINNQTVFVVDGGALLIYLADTVDENTLEQMIALSPEQVLCLDAGFEGNDQLKNNIVLQMKDAGISFRTV